jgi:hypothetical protein
MRESDIDQLKEYYPVSEDVERANSTGKEKVTDRVIKPFTTPGESEANFASRFDDLATLRGWTWCGFRPARIKIDGKETYRTPVTGLKGLPDRVLARNGTVLLVEFKTDTGSLSKEQRQWGEALNGFAGYHVVRPRDWAFIERLLVYGRARRD